MLIPQSSIFSEFCGLSSNLLLTGSFFHPISVDLQTTYSHPRHFSIRFPLTSRQLPLIPVTFPSVFHGLLDNLLLTGSSNTPHHTIACFAWPGGVREGRAAFATSSASPRMLQLRDGPPRISFSISKSLAGLRAAPSGASPLLHLKHHIRHIHRGLPM